MFAFGEVVFLDERTRGAEAALAAFHRGGFDQVLMPNPYGNATRLRVYRELRASGARVIASDRGALPDTWFFDGGFNADSDSYRPEHWDHPLPLEEQDATRDYLRRLRGGGRALEEQGPRRGASRLRRTLGLEGQRVLFVPLQRPGDTVVRYFADNVDGLEGFLTFVRDLTSRLARGGDHPWVVVYKKHPLERDAPTVQGAVRAPDEAHVHDLLDMADATLVLNSGVGLLSLAFGKPTLHVGEVFYGAPGLSISVRSPDAAAEHLTNATPQPDPEKVERFVHHLTRRVYSFVDPRTELESEAGGALRRVTRSLRFRTLNVLGRAIEVDSPRVLVLCPLTPWPSSRGSQSRMDAMIRGLIDRGARVDLAVLDSSQPAPTQTATRLRERYPEAGAVVVHPHPHGRGSWYRRVDRLLDAVTGDLHRIANRSTCPPSFRRAVRDLCARRQPDYILVNYAKLTPALPRDLDAIRVVDTHDHQTALLREDQSKNRIRRWVNLSRFAESESRALARYDRLIAIGESEARTFASLCPTAEVHCIPAFTPARVDEGVETDIDMLFVGSISNFNVKGLRWFVDEVLPLVRRDLPDLVLTVVGSVTRARELSLRTREVRALGVVSDLDSVYARSRLVIAPLLGGAGMKIKVVEALSRGKPLVCTHHAAEGIALTHGVSAWLADAPHDFARGVVALSRDEELRGRIAVGGRAVHAEDHSPEAAASRLSAVFRLGPVQPTSVGAHGTK